jgi:hypothetical protein
MSNILRKIELLFDFVFQFVSSNSIPIDHMARLEKLVDSVPNPSKDLVEHYYEWLRQICAVFE